MILKNNNILILFIFRLCTCVNYTSNVFDYCYHPDCSLHRQHTLCVTKGRHSSRLFAVGVTPWIRHQLLLLHNKHRDNIAMGLEAGQPKAANMRKMYWDYELEGMAEAWARQCQNRHDECRNSIRFSVLQNMDVRLIGSGVTEAQLLADAVGSWFSGSRSLPSEYFRSFRLSKCVAPRGCNYHWYSAAAWASTWRIGCSQSLCTMNKDSCVNYAKVRMSGSSLINTTKTKSDAKSPRGPKCYTTAKPTTLDEFGAERSGQSLLYRGAMDNREETKIVAYTFCNYGPAGNVEGFPIYEVGTTCTNCPQGTECTDRTHRGLCSVIGDPDTTT